MTVTFQVGDREFGGAGNLEMDFWVSLFKCLWWGDGGWVRKEGGGVMGAKGRMGMEEDEGGGRRIWRRGLSLWMSRLEELATRRHWHSITSSAINAHPSIRLRLPTSVPLHPPPAFHSIYSNRTKANHPWRAPHRSSTQQTSTSSTTKPSRPATIASKPATTANTSIASATRPGLPARRRSALMCTELCMCRRVRRRVIRWRMKVRSKFPYMLSLLVPRGVWLGWVMGGG